MSTLEYPGASLVRTSVSALPHIWRAGGGAADDVDGAGGVDHGRVVRSASPRRAGRAIRPGHTCVRPTRATRPMAPPRKQSPLSSHCTRTHARTHTRTHTHTHSPTTRTYTHTSTHARTHANTQERKLLPRKMRKCQRSIPSSTPRVPLEYPSSTLEYPRVPLHTPRSSA